MPAPRPRLPRNLLLLYGGEGMAKLLGLLAFALLGRELGDAGLGRLEFAIAIFFVLNLVMEAGLGPYGAREAAKHPEREGLLASRIVSLRLVLLALSAVLLAGAARVGADSPEERRLVLLYGLALVPGPFMLSWAFQARDRMGIVAASTFLRQAVFLALVVTLVDSRESIHLVPIADASGLACVVVFQQVAYARLGGRLRPTFAPTEIAVVAREAAPIAASTLSWALRMFAPTIALGALVPADETGHFGAAHRLIVSLHTFAWLYFFNLLPSISRATLDLSRGAYRTLQRTSLAVVGWVVLPGCLALSDLAPLLLPAIYGPEFEPAAPLFRWLVWMPALAFVSGHFRYALIAFGRVGTEFRANALGAGVCVAGLAALGVADALTPRLAAAVFLGAELTTLAAAHLAVASAIEPLSLVRPLWKPALAVGLSLLVGPALLGEAPVARAGLSLGLGVAGLLLFDRGLVARLARHILPGAR